MKRAKKNNDNCLLSGKCKVGVKKGVKVIEVYYKENPQFYLYDLAITSKKPKKQCYKYYISKASVLGLQHIKSAGWRIFEDKLKQLSRPRTMNIENIAQLEHEIAGIGKATLTKTFHLLHPTVIPLVDSKIEKEVKRSNCYKYFKKFSINEFHAVMQAIKNVAKNNDNSLRQICININKKYKTTITPLRAWDIIVWSSIKK